MAVVHGRFLWFSVGSKADDARAGRAKGLAWVQCFSSAILESDAGDKEAGGKNEQHTANDDDVRQDSKGDSLRWFGSASSVESSAKRDSEDQATDCSNAAQRQAKYPETKGCSAYRPPAKH